MRTPQKGEVWYKNKTNLSDPNEYPVVIAKVNQFENWLKLKGIINKKYPISDFVNSHYFKNEVDGNTGATPWSEEGAKAKRKEKKANFVAESIEPVAPMEQSENEDKQVEHKIKKQKPTLAKPINSKAEMIYGLEEVSIKRCDFSRVGQMCDMYDVSNEDFVAVYLEKADRSEIVSLIVKSIFE